MKKNKYISAVLMVVFSAGLYAAPLAPDIVVIDDQRSLELTTETAVTLDRRTLQAQTAKALEQGGTGLMVRTLAGYNARLVYTSGGTPSGGELSNLDLLNSIVGPVTTNKEVQSQIEFAVLLAPVVIDGDTVVVGADSISDIAVGSIVAVSGLQAQNGAVNTTRIEVLDSGFPYWILTGDIMNLSVDGFSIGGQNINQDANTVIDCGDVTLENGLKVITELTPIPNYTVGDSLDATSIICYTAFENPPGGGDTVFFSGEISFVNDALSQITIDGVRVNVNADTFLMNGVLENLAIGVEVEVAGILDDNTGEVTASAIRFLVDLYSAGAPVAPEDITLSEPGATNGVLNIMGMAVQQNALTYDPLEVFTNNIIEETSLGFVGYKDSQGTIWASAVFESRRNPNQGEGGGPITFLQATVDSLNGGQLIVAGVNIDTTGGVFFDSEFNIISETDFLASLSVGDRILINEADSYDKVTNTLLGGRYFALGGNGGGGGGGGGNQRSANNPIGGAGTVTEVIEDLIFTGEF